MKKLLSILFCLLPVLGGKAQTIYGNQIRIDNKSITRSDDNLLTIRMDLILQDNLKMTSNNEATLTPYLEANGRTKVLPAIVVYGRKRQLINQRNHQRPKEAYTTIRRERNETQKTQYLIQLPYEAWMRQADLKLNVDMCGCCDVIESAGEMIAKLNIAPLKIQPAIAYITPQAEEVKHRAVEGTAYLDFPVNKIIIYPEYRRNSVELSKIRASIDTVRNDKNTQLTGITIHGYASPEGSYANNTRLAKGRTQALVDYVTSYYNFDHQLITSEYTSEDWEGFRTFVEASTMSKKEEILRMMDDSNINIDTKERNIAGLIGQQAYQQYLLKECYPALRHSDYTVNYTVRGFNLEESKEMIKTRPQLLSLEEIYRVAQSYTPGSEAFNHAFQVAAVMFPDDPIANLNAAAMEIQKGGDLTSAKKHLAKADRKAAETINNLGVIAMMEGELEMAEKYFEEAKAAGLTEQANTNLTELKKKQNYPVN